VDTRRREGRPSVAQADPAARYRVTAVQVMTGVPCQHAAVVGAALRLVATGPHRC
jgi:hypothetical protein